MNKKLKKKNTNIFSFPLPKYFVISVIYEFKNKWIDKPPTDIQPNRQTDRQIDMQEWSCKSVKCHVELLLPRVWMVE